MKIDHSRARISNTRTCIGCGQRADRSALVRVVADRRAVGSVVPVPVVPDIRAVLPGRGAWLHPDADCLSKAIRRRAFGRALRLTQAVDTDAVQQFVADRHEGLDQTQR
ncbi:YlxR family protein [Branchiibius sp. NY16-3462-2]|uniref:YlxR family protein n=1 Tax=Branchiibius sp. NY16-3462-2 TaxID=1807500 RepID=UPI0025BDD20C|nr:YlxR family protein [Branchiibius sp. NY16-3462-2]